jgi:hypothetical protein
MTTNESSISVQDYSESVIRIQHLNRDLQKKMQSKDFVEARNLARLIAVEAMHIGVWCREFIKKTEE